MRGILVTLLALVGGSAVTAQSPLFWALANNDAVGVWSLTTTTVPPLLDDNTLSPARWAVSRGNFEAVNALLWRGVPLDDVDERGRNLLYGAASLGRVDLFETIRAAGAKVDVVDRDGVTLVHVAAQAPHPEVLDLLLHLGQPATSRTALGVTPLMEACEAGRAEDVALLLAWGGVAEDQDFLGRSVRDYAQRSGDPGTIGLIDAALRPWTIEPDDRAPLP